MMARASVVLPAPSSPLSAKQIAAPRHERQVLAQADKLGLADTIDDVGNGD